MNAYYIPISYEEFNKRIREVYTPVIIEEDFPILHTTAKTFLSMIEDDLSDNFSFLTCLHDFNSHNNYYRAITDQEALGIILATATVLYTDLERARKKSRVLAEVDDFENRSILEEKKQCACCSQDLFKRSYRNIS